MTKMFYNVAPRNLDEAKGLLLKKQKGEPENANLVSISKTFFHHQQDKQKARVFHTIVFVREMLGIHLNWILLYSPKLYNTSNILEEQKISLF
jgi:hypothetical protein